MAEVPTNIVEFVKTFRRQRRRLASTHAALMLASCFIGSWNSSCGVKLRHGGESLGN